MSTCLISFVSRHIGARVARAQFRFLFTEALLQKASDADSKCCFEEEHSHTYSTQRHHHGQGSSQLSHHKTRCQCQAKPQAPCKPFRASADPFWALPIHGKTPQSHRWGVLRRHRQSNEHVEKKEYCEGLNKTNIACV